MERMTLTLGEVAEVLGVSVDSVKDRVKDGTLKSLKFGHRRLIPRDVLEDYLRSAS